MTFSDAASHALGAVITQHPNAFAVMAVTMIIATDLVVLAGVAASVAKEIRAWKDRKKTT